MPLVILNFWAGARAAARTASESVEAPSVAEAIELVLTRHRDEEFSRVIRVSSVLVDGVTVSGTGLRAPLTGPTTVEILPPFAGG